MQDPLKAAARIEQIREELRQIMSEFPDLYLLLRGSILPDDDDSVAGSDSVPIATANKSNPSTIATDTPDTEEPYTPVTAFELESRPNWQIIAEYLAENPWSTLLEIAEGTGIRFSIVNSTIYCGGKGRFTSRADTRSKDKRAKVWNNGAVGEVSRIGNKTQVRTSTRKTTTKMIVQWLKSNGPASVADIAKGIESDVKTDPAKLKASVRSILSRLANDKLMRVEKVDGGNLYSVVNAPQEKQ